MRAALLALRLRASLCGPAALVLACAPAAQAEPATLELEIAGMVCESCAQAITAAVEKLDGVRACRVTIRPQDPPSPHAVAGRAVIDYDPARIDSAAISAAISRIGYTPSPP